MEKLGKISQGDWEHLRKVLVDTPPKCPYLVLTVTSGKKFGLAKIQDGIYYQINLMHLQPPAKRSSDVEKPEPVDWEEAENHARNLLETCSFYEPTTKK